MSCDWVFGEATAVQAEVEGLEVGVDVEVIGRFCSGSGGGNGVQI